MFRICDFRSLVGSGWKLSCKILFQIYVRVKTEFPTAVRSLSMVLLELLVGQILLHIKRILFS